MAKEPTLDQLRALVARMEAETAAASDLDPTAAFAAELDDHRVDPRTLAAFVRRVARGFEALGVDIHAEPADDADAEAPADDAATDETATDAVTTGPASRAKKGK